MLVNFSGVIQVLIITKSICRENFSVILRKIHEVRIHVKRLHWSFSFSFFFDNTWPFYYSILGSGLGNQNRITNIKNEV